MDKLTVSEEVTRALVEALDSFITYLDGGTGTLPNEVEHAMRTALAKAQSQQGIASDNAVDPHPA